MINPDGKGTWYVFIGPFQPRFFQGPFETQAEAEVSREEWDRKKTWDRVEYTVAQVVFPSQFAEAQMVCLRCHYWFSLDTPCKCAYTYYRVEKVAE